MFNIRTCLIFSSTDILLPAQTAFVSEYFSRSKFALEKRRKKRLNIGRGHNIKELTHLEFDLGLCSTSKGISREELFYR